MKASRNIVFCGFSNIEKNKIKIQDIRTIKKYSWENAYYNRFPYLVFLDDINTASRHQGFLIVIKNISIYNYFEIDKKYRSKLRNYKYIIFCSKMGSKYLEFQPYSNMAIVDESLIYTNYFKNQIEYLYQINIKKIENSKPLTKKQEMYIKKIKEYIKDKELVSTKEIAKYISLSERSTQRYINIMNEIYINIGYLDKSNKWYTLK